MITSNRLLVRRYAPPPKTSRSSKRTASRSNIDVPFLNRGQRKWPLRSSKVPDGAAVVEPSIDYSPPERGASASHTYHDAWKRRTQDGDRASASPEPRPFIDSLAGQRSASRTR